MTIRFSKKGPAWKRFTQAEIVTPIAKPDASNTGHNPALIDGTITGNVSITSNGYVLENKIITGYVIVKAANVIIRNCWIQGEGTLVRAWDAPCQNLLVEYCTLAPSTPSITSQGIHGHGYTARFCNVYNVVDGFGAFDGTGVPANVLIERNWVHDLYCNLDAGQWDGITHNDCIQIHGSGGIHIFYNNLESNPSTGSLSTVGGTSCVMMQPGKSYGNCDDVRIENNWLNYGTACLNLGRGSLLSTATAQAIVRNNRFGRKGSRTGGASVDTMTYRILAASALDCPGLPSSTGPDINNGNVFDDTGLPVTVNRG